MDRLELLSPAKNLETGLAAIDHGADAVYIGAQRFGARAAAGNSVDDIAELCRYAHQFGAKVYVTVNTIIYDDELEDTRLLLRSLVQAHVDAILVQDMAVPQLLRSVMASLPEEERWPVALHASTQTDNRTAEKVRWLYSQGFSRVVLARELSIEQIRDIHQQVPEVELEAFVHGALCVSFSGQCYASQFCQHRSANRGECAQMCRMAYDLVDADGREIEHQRYLLSLRDMCRIDHLQEMAEAGVCSFKIEGRLKDVPYVKNVTAAYSQRLNQIVDASQGRYQRASMGRCSYTFMPDVRRSFNRGFTTYGLFGRTNDFCNPDTPKAMGQMVGVVKTITRQWLQVSSVDSVPTFSNGDGLCFLDADRQLVGFRVNRAEGTRLFPQRMPEQLRVGMPLYRNADQSFDRLLSGKSSERKIDVTMSFEPIADGFVLRIMMGEREIGQASLAIEHQQAERPQHDNIIRQLTKLGGTPYRCIDIDIPNDFRWFIPSSLLADLRRTAVASITQSPGPPRPPHGGVTDTASSHPDEYSLPPMGGLEGASYRLNISNHIAQQYYEAQGIKDVSPAMEVSTPKGEALLMQCRHCLRYMLGHCVKHGGTRPTWREPLYLRLADGRRFRLDFDCLHCQMNVIAPL